MSILLLLYGTGEEEAGPPAPPAPVTAAPGPGGGVSGARPGKPRRGRVAPFNPQWGIDDDEDELLLLL